MVLPVIVCLIKPSSPICKEETTTTTVSPLDGNDLTQDELLEYGGIGLVFNALFTMLNWAFSKALKYRRQEWQRVHDSNTAELQEIRRQLTESSRKLI